MPASKFTRVADCVTMFVCFMVWMCCMGLAFTAREAEPFFIWMFTGLTFLGGTLWLAIEIYRGRWQR